MSEIIFATGCDIHYIRAWFQLYKSIKKFLPNSIIYFYDLGLSTDDIVHIKQLDIRYEYFDFSQYPEWVHIKKDAGQWAWKAQIIKDIMVRYEPSTSKKQYLIWCDARNQLENNLQRIINFIEKNGIYTNITDGRVRMWTVPQTLQYLDGYKYADNHMKNAALPCFNINIDWVRDFINEYARLSLIKECIFPEGSSRRNHRQDQSIFSILYYKYKDTYSFDESNFYGGIRIHTGNIITRPYHLF